MYKLVLLRHGESTWNKENRFTGWTDVPLSEQGIAEADAAGKLLHEAGFSFDIAYTSLLQRAINTLHIALTQLNSLWIPVYKSWRLNERHYGALQGLNKKETADTHGAEQVKIWRRSYAVSPPPVETSDERYPGNDIRYKDLSQSELPHTECLQDTVKRVLPLWHQTLAPAIKEGRRIIITAHGNSLRALVKYLDSISDEAIIALNIPTGIPLIYELDAELSPIQHYYLGNTEAIAAKADAVAKQSQ